MNLGRVARIAGVSAAVTMVVAGATGVTWAATSNQSSAMAAPGPVSLFVQSTSVGGAAATKTTTLTALGVTVEALCAPNAQSSIYISDTGTLTSTYLVSGTTFLSGTNPNGILVFQPSAGSTVQNTPLTAQSSGFRYQQVANRLASSEVVLRSGSLIGSLLLQRGTHTATVSVSAVQLATACTVTAQVNPGS